MDNLLLSSLYFVSFVSQPCQRTLFYILLPACAGELFLLGAEVVAAAVAPVALRDTVYNDFRFTYYRHIVCIFFSGLPFDATRRNFIIICLSVDREGKKCLPFGYGLRNDKGTEADKGGAFVVHWLLPKVIRDNRAFGIARSPRIYAIRWTAQFSIDVNVVIADSHAKSGLSCHDTAVTDMHYDFCCLMIERKIGRSACSYMTLCSLHTGNRSGGSLSRFGLF